MLRSTSLWQRRIGEASERLKLLFLLPLLFLIVACTGVPKGIQPVTGINSDKYLGKWYEKEEYQYAFVTGYDRDYLWFLSRTPDVSEEAIARFKEVALKAGFDLEELVVVDHSSAK